MSYTTTGAANTTITITLQTFEPKPAPKSKSSREHRPKDDLAGLTPEQFDEVGKGDVWWHIYADQPHKEHNNFVWVYYIDAILRKERIAWDSTTRPEEAARQWKRRTYEDIEPTPEIDRKVIGVWCFWMTDLERLAHEGNKS